MALRGVRTGASWLLDFALPPRCPGCGEIKPAVNLFCSTCWGALQYLSGGCERCGLPLQTEDREVCPSCEQGKGPLHRVRAALGHGDVPRTIAMRLRYGRKVALARTIASVMKRPLAQLDPEATLLPVPLHR